MPATLCLAPRSLRPTLPAAIVPLPRCPIQKSSNHQAPSRLWPSRASFRFGAARIDGIARAACALRRVPHICVASFDTASDETSARCGAMSRREFGVSALVTGNVLIAGEARAEPTPPPETKTSPLGVKYQVIKEGSGEIAAQTGDYVTFDYVLRRSNGYFVYSTTGSGSGQQEPTKFARNFQEEPVTFLLGDGKLIAGLEEVLGGRRVGARVRALVPPEAGYLNNALQPQPPSFGPKRELASHSNQPLFFELEVRKVVPS